MTTTNILLIIILIVIIHQTDKNWIINSIVESLSDLLIFIIDIILFPLTLYRYLTTYKKKANKLKKKESILQCFNEDEIKLLKDNLINENTNILDIRNQLESFNKFKDGQLDKRYLKLENIYTILLYIKEDKIDELRSVLHAKK